VPEVELEVSTPAGASSGIDTAVPLALVVYEMLSAVAEMASSLADPATVGLRLEARGDWWRLTITTSPTTAGGRGESPDSTEGGMDPNLSRELIEALASQMNGEAALEEVGERLHLEFAFPVPGGTATSG